MPDLIRITTRTLAATSTEGTRVKVHASTGEEAVYPHTYKLHGPEFHEACALKLARQLFPEGTELGIRNTGEHGTSGYRFGVWKTV